MEKKSSSIFLRAEYVPILTLLGKQYSILLSDFSYGEWLIFKKNEPVFYLNLFDPENYELMNALKNTAITLDNLLARINIEENDTLSLNQNFCFFIKFGKSIYKNIEIQKFPKDKWENRLGR